ncbi:MAG: nitroreductase [Clostridia bacterium]|nr:nitroreductase [Clostridia bacterium]
MNQTITDMLSRRSIRSYKPDPIPEELLNQILEAGTYAATGGGRQSPVMVLVTDKPLRDKLSKMNAAVMGKDVDPFYGAPVVVSVLADPARNTYVEDGSLVIGNLMLAASTLNIGSCWIHRAKEMFESPEGKELLNQWGIPGYVGIGNCILGYVNGEIPEAAPRKEGYIIKA